MNDKKFPSDPKDKKRSDNRMYGTIALLAGIALLFVGFSFQSFVDSKIESLVFGAVLVVIGAVMLLRGINPADQVSVPGTNGQEETDEDIRNAEFMSLVWRLIKVLSAIILAVWFIGTEIQKGGGLLEIGSAVALLLVAVLLLLSIAVRRRKR